MFSFLLRGEPMRGPSLFPPFFFCTKDRDVVVIGIVKSSCFKMMPLRLDGTGKNQTSVDHFPVQDDVFNRSKTVLQLTATAANLPIIEHQLLPRLPKPSRWICRGRQPEEATPGSSVRPWIEKKKESSVRKRTRDPRVRNSASQSRTGTCSDIPAE